MKPKLLFLTALLAVTAVAQNVDTLPAITGAAVDKTNDKIMLRDASRSAASGGLVAMPIGQLVDIPGMFSTLEPALGNPDTNGKVLSSSADGERYWITPGGGGSGYVVPTGLVSDGMRIIIATVTTGATNHIFCPGHDFSGRAGQLIRVEGGGANGFDHVTTIAASPAPSYQYCTLTVAPITAIAANATCFFGTDNTAAINAAIVACKASTTLRGVFIPVGVYLANVKMYAFVDLRGSTCGISHTSIENSNPTSIAANADKATVLLPALDAPVIEFDETPAGVDAGCQSSKVSHMRLLGSDRRGFRSYGIKYGDNGQAFVGTMASGSAVVTASLPVFLSSHVGRSMDVPGAGAGGAKLIANITSYQSPTQVTLATTNTSGSNVTAQPCAFGGQSGFFGQLFSAERMHICGFKYGIAATRVAEAHFNLTQIASCKIGFNLAEIEEVGTLRYSDAITFSNISALDTQTLFRFDGCKSAVIHTGDANGLGRAATSMVAGRKYVIRTAGNTDFVAGHGAASNTPGVVFTAAGAGTGTGIVQTESDFKSLIWTRNSKVVLNGFNCELPWGDGIVKDGGELVVNSIRGDAGLGAGIADLGTANVGSTSVLTQNYVGGKEFYVTSTANLSLPEILPRGALIGWYADNSFQTARDIADATYIYQKPFAKQFAVPAFDDQFVRNRVTSPYGSMGWLTTNIAGGSQVITWQSNKILWEGNSGLPKTGRFSLGHAPYNSLMKYELRYDLSSNNLASATQAFRWGMYSLDSASTPQNGIGFAAAQSVGANFQLEVWTNGTATRVDTGIAMTNANYSFVIRHTGIGIYGVIYNSQGTPIWQGQKSGTLNSHDCSPAIYGTDPSGSGYQVIISRIQLTPYGKF